MAGWEDDFLVDLEPRRWSAPDGAPSSITPSLLFLGNGDHPLEVALASSASRPRAEDVRRLWTARQGRRPSPLLLVVGYPEAGATALTVCGPAGEQPTLLHGLSVSQVERLSAAALTEPNRHSAVRFLVAMLPEVESDLPGLRNSGLLATQELRNGVPARPDWSAATNSGKHLLPLNGRRLIEGLGFTVATLSTNSSVLTVGGGGKRAVAIFLDEGETFDDSADRFQGTSPVSHALAQADQEGLPWVVLTRGRQIRLYAARSDTGVGRKGRAETFVEVNLALLPEDRAGYLPLLFGADALSDGGTIEDILDRSADFAAELAARLRERVYFDTVPQLATAVAARLGDTGALSDDGLADAYEQTLVILFRLLFVAYAEDKDLLPYRSNSKYADHSLKRIVRRLAEDRRAGRQDFDDQAIDLWEDVRQLWRAVDRGNRGWGVPGYNGGLFSDAPGVNAAGAVLATLDLTDAEFGPALTAMLVDEGADGVIGPVDFRSLSVREFGTIYEGLLESMLSIAPSDLTTDSKGNYVPAKKQGDEVLVAAGQVYFHNRSGARKATGSYFTKPFAVEHLLDHALEPALDDHLSRIGEHLDRGDEAAAADAFFDFRCVDLAMGSGHFLVAAVDRIEARLSNFLALRPIPAINAELDTLRGAALEALGDLADGVEIESTSLLRRQVARRCIYGVDLNHISVELARLAIWIHTFVPGLPLSFLDHSLVCGNSLTGIGTLDEALDVLDPDHGKGGAVSLFRAGIEEFLGRASASLHRLARITETTAADVQEARQVHNQALEAIEPARQLFDLLLAVRLGEAPVPVNIDEEALSKSPGVVRGRGLVRELDTLHFPISFPEVFLRDRPGFDCILGNPPWEKLQLEEHSFYALSYPGLRGMRQEVAEQQLAAIREARPDLVAEYERETRLVQRMKEALAKGPYPGLSAGRPDLYKAFAWRFLQLVRDSGTVGVVLPRKAVEASGMRDWRLEALSICSFEDVTMLLNSGGWVFDDAEPRYTIGLLSLLRTVDASARRVRLRGPFANRDAYNRGLAAAPGEFAATDLLGWSSGAEFPLLPSVDHLRVFSLIRSSPALSGSREEWAARGMRELNASDDKEHFVFTEKSTDLWPVYKGESFDLWKPEAGGVYAYAEPTTITTVLNKRRSNQVRLRRSNFHGYSAEWAQDPATLPAAHPRIAWRDSSRATDSRTVRVALIPPNTVLVHQAYTLFFRSGGPRAEAFVLGVLSSIPFDWFARQLVESHVTVEFINSAPVPSPSVNPRVSAEVTRIAGHLAAIDDRFEGWAAEVGVEVQSVAPEQRDDLVARLDAAVAHLYGLSKADLTFVFETFHPGWDFAPRLATVLDHYRDMA